MSQQPFKKFAVKKNNAAIKEKFKQEQKNLIHIASYKPVFATMKRELIRQRNLYDDHEPAGELK